MRTTRILLVACCLAALPACSAGDEPTGSVSSPEIIRRGRQVSATGKMPDGGFITVKLVPGDVAPSGLIYYYVTLEVGAAVDLSDAPQLGIPTFSLKTDNVAIPSQFTVVSGGLGAGVTIAVPHVGALGVRVGGDAKIEQTPEGAQLVNSLKLQLGLSTNIKFIRGNVGVDVGVSRTVKTDGTVKIAPTLGVFVEPFTNPKAAAVAAGSGSFTFRVEGAPEIRDLINALPPGLGTPSLPLPQLPPGAGLKSKDLDANPYGDQGDTAGVLGSFIENWSGAVSGTFPSALNSAGDFANASGFSAYESLTNLDNVEFGFANERLPAFDLRGVDFSRMSFEGFTLDPATGVPVFQARLTPTVPGEATLSLAEMGARRARFQRYFLEGIALRDEELQVSLDTTAPGQAGVRASPALRETFVGRQMVEHDLLMKRTYLREVSAGPPGTTGEGILPTWVALLKESPHYGAWLERGFLPTGLDASLRGLIVGETVRVNEDPASGVRVVEAPLGLTYAIDRLAVSHDNVLPHEVADLDARLASLRAVVQQRLESIGAKYRQIINTAPEYAELRLVYSALAQARVYKILAAQGVTENVPYLDIFNSNALPPALRPQEAFPEADYARRASEVVVTATAAVPCGTLPSSGEIYCPTETITYDFYGGVEWNTFQRAASPQEPWERAVSDFADWSVVQRGGSYVVPIASSLPSLAELVVRVAGKPSASPGEALSIAVRNIGEVTPGVLYTRVFDEVVDAQGQITRSTLRVEQLTAPPARGETLSMDLDCTACLPEDGLPAGSHKRIRVNVVAGELAGNTLNQATEVSQRNNTAVFTYFKPGGETGCRVTQPTCTNHPDFVGVFADDHEGASSNPDRCLARAAEYAGWCNNPASVASSALFLKGGYTRAGGRAQGPRAE